MFSGVPILKEFLGYTAGLVCPESDDGYHHASSYEVDRESGYYNCICDVCGWPFLAYETDLQQAYETQVSELPATGVTSSGDLLVVLYPSYMSVQFTSGRDDYYSYSPSSTLTSDSFNFTDIDIIFNETNWSVFLSKSYSFSISNYVKLHFDYIAPVDCTVDIFQPAEISYYYDNVLQDTFVFSSASFSGLFVQGKTYSDIKWFSPNTDVFTLSAALSKPFILKLTPIEDIGVSYAIDSRPTSFVGDYGIIGDNGQITKVDNTSIVNETNNTYTNPCTGTTSTITEWSYDYSDRSYNVTTESGDTVTITYGDENITIQEGDTIYNVYYMVDEDPGGEPGVDPTESPAPGVCQHKYTSVTDREATCTFAGQVTYTCSLCGHSYTESIPATGHAWDIKETVQTSYDEEGNLLQQGYTIYKCSVCGEEYKDETGTGPPGSGDGSGSGSGEEGESIWDKLGNLIGTILGTIIDIISAVIGKILDALLALVEMIGDKLVAVVDLVLSFFDEIPRLFSGFLAFLTAVFPFLPEEVMLLLTFGIAVIVFIGIIKALRR